MYKKLSLGLAAVLLTVLLALSGCGGGSDQKNSGSSKPSEKPQSGDQTLGPVKVTLVGGSVGGTWAALGEGIGEAIRRTAPNSSFGYQPGQDGANVVTVMSGQAELGINYVVLAKAAYEGREPYQQKFENLRAICQVAPLTFQFLATEKSGIKSFQDLKKRPAIIGVNTKNGTMELAARTILEEHGVTYQDIEKAGGKVLYLASGPILDMMKDGRADGRTTIANLPEAKITDASMMTKMVIIPPDKDALERTISKLGVSPSKVPKGTYSFVNEDVPSFEVPIMILCSKDLPEKTAYTVTRAIVEQLPYLKTVYAGMADDTPESICKTPILLHPGAEKYYRDKGLL
ncbi:MAG: TAXI family TRAP transporter solute-binding subunit [Bacillota bacterium]